MPKETDDHINSLTNFLANLKFNQASVSIWGNKLFVFLNNPHPDSEDLLVVTELLVRSNPLNTFTSVRISNGEYEITLSQEEVQELQALIIDANTTYPDMPETFDFADPDQITPPDFDLGLMGKYLFVEALSN